MRSPLASYGVSLAAVVVAIILRWLLNPLLGEFLPLVTLFGAVAVAVWFGGFRPALLVAALGYLACHYLFIEPRGLSGFNNLRNLVGLIAYLITCFIIIGFGEAMLVAHRRFEVLAQSLLPTSAAIEDARRKHNLRDVNVIGFGVIAAVLVVGGVLGYANTHRLIENARLVSRSHEVIVGLETLLSTLKDAEIGQRGYLLTEDVKYLQPYDDAVSRVQDETNRLQEFTSDNPDQQARFAVLEHKVAVRMDELNRTVALLKEGDRPAALQLVRGNIGKALMDDVRDAIAAMLNVEHDLMRQRADDSEAISRTMVLSILLTAVIGVLLVGVVFILSRRNVIQRQRATEVLAGQRERLRVTLASIGDAVITTDVAGCITYLNAVAESLTGWTQDEAAGQPLDIIFRIVNEQTRKPVENPAMRALREGVVVGLANHTVLMTKSGAERPIDDSAAPIRGKADRAIGCVLVFRDITERRRTEQQRADDEARIRSVVNHVVDGIITMDEGGKVESFNLAAEKLFGYKAAEVIDHNVNMLMPEPFHSEHERYVANYLRTGHAKIIGIGREVEGRRKDGSTFPLALAVSEFSLGNRRYFTGIVRNITEEKEAERRIYGLMADLQEADRRKDEFLAMLAHELRGPLAPLSNMLEIMKRADGKGDLLQQARTTMERQLLQMVRLVDDLLDVSRITRNKLLLRRERVELASVVYQAVETTRPLAEHFKHEVVVTLPPEPIHLHADPVRLAQVFSNLLNNSCKYTEPGGRIWLTAERQGSDVVVSVKDTGVGIPPDRLIGIFEMFAQVDRSLERSNDGLGIGLTLVKRLVEMHDGSVEAVSEGAGRGSEFVVRLPIVVEKPKTHPPAKLAASKQATIARRILVVDDNRDSAASLAMLLKFTGNETYLAYDGLEAVEATEQYRPDVVLLDIGLPKLNGLDACRRIREQPWGKDLVLVALTGWGQEEDRRKSKDAGFDHHMVKPVEYAALMKLLDELIPTPV